MKYIKLFYLLAIFVYAIGVIGAAGFCFYSNEYVLAVAVIFVGVLAFPGVKEIWNKLNK